MGNYIIYSITEMKTNERQQSGIISVNFVKYRPYFKTFQIKVEYLNDTHTLFVTRYFYTMKRVSDKIGNIQFNLHVR